MTPEDRIQVMVMPQNPKSFAATAALTDEASTAAMESQGVAALPPSSQSAAAPLSAVAVAPAKPLWDRRDVAAPKPEVAAVEEMEQAPEIAESELAEDESVPEVEEATPEDSKVTDTAVEDEPAPEPIAENPEPNESESAIAQTPQADTDEAATSLTGEDALTADGVTDEAPRTVTSAAIADNDSTLETSTTGVADALSRLLGNGRSPGNEASASSGDNAANPPDTALLGVARNTGPDSRSETGTDLATGEEADGASADAGSGSRTVSCRQCSRPDYPTAALAAGIEGQPVVRAQFDDDGNVIGLTLEQSSGNAALDQAALSSLQTWEFETGGQGGSVSVEIPFVIEGSERHQEAQQQGDRETVTVNPETPIAEATPASQPVQAAADPLLDLPNQADSSGELGIILAEADADADTADTASTDAEPIDTDAADTEDASSATDAADAPITPDTKPAMDSSEPPSASSTPEPAEPTPESAEAGEEEN
ncbi:MAG: TonB family protein [Leptolyngbyaceae cyanobacterium SM1_1_3]|nr:TonB family protein [Leptolyngbyaceae cyanobacterium SM1_1_3]